VGTAARDILKAAGVGENDTSRCSDYSQEWRAATGSGRWYSQRERLIGNAADDARGFERADRLRQHPPGRPDLRRLPRLARGPRVGELPPRRNALQQMDDADRQRHQDLFMLMFAVALNSLSATLHAEPSGAPPTAAAA
jgi:hypothetical protein